MRRIGGTFLLCLVLSGCSVIDAATGGDDGDDVECTHDICYRVPDTFVPVDVEHVATDDLDGDDTPDLAAVSGDGDIFNLLNDDDTRPGTFSEEDQEADFTGAPAFVTATDINGDDFAEVIASVPDSNTVQARSTVIQSLQVDVENPGQLLAAEINGDTRGDVLVAANVGGVDRLVLLFGHPTSGFDSTIGTIDTSGPIADFTVGDFDGDGDLDIAVITIAPDSQLTVYENDGTANFTTVPPFAPCLTTCPSGADEELLEIEAGNFEGGLAAGLVIHVICPDCTVPYEQLRFLRAPSAIDTWQEFRNYSVFTQPQAGASHAASQLRVAHLDTDETADVTWEEFDVDDELCRVLLFEDFFSSGSPDIGRLIVGEQARETVLDDFNADGLTDIATATFAGGVDIVLTEN